MQKVLKNLLSIGLAIAMFVGIGTIVRSSSTELVVADASSSYYSDINATGGTQLLGQVHDLITSTHTNYTSYDNCRDYGTETDPGLDGRGALEFYTHESISSFSGNSGTWNREHVWAQSLSNDLWGKSGGGSDLHHIRPSEGSLNGTRGNKLYGKVTNGTAAYSKTTSGGNSKLGGHYSNSTFEPLDGVKGDVARIVMYVYTHYNTASNVYGSTNGSGSSNYFGTLNFTDIITASTESAAISLLLEWNKIDPVDQIERTRNEVAYKYQGNRNAFIDHPEYADAIWGNGTVTPGDASVAPSGLTMSSSSVALSVGQTKTLSVTATPSNASKAVSWTSSDSSVASVSNGVVTANAAGSATITATSTANSSISTTAQITVKKATSNSASGTATITLSSFSLTDGYGFKNWSAGGISGIAYIFGGNASFKPDSMQFTTKQDSYYLASNTATSGSIKSVTVKSKKDSTDREWKLLTSNTPYGEVSGKPTNGTDQGTKTVTSSGVTWTISGDDTYFALTYEYTGTTSPAAYLESITIEYGGTSGSGDVGGEDNPGGNTPGGDVGGDVGGETDSKISQFHTAVSNLVTDGSLATRYAAISKAIAIYQSLSEEEKFEVFGDIVSLQLAIIDYNKAVKEYNEESQKVNGAVIGG